MWFLPKFFYCFLSSPNDKGQINFVKNFGMLRRLILLFTLYLFANFNGMAQELKIPKNPLKGRLVFEQKGCINCHSIKGEGGVVGPDLGKQKFYGSFLDLASIMWNHSPEMLRRMRELDLPFPEFSNNEMVDLIAYLYFLRYLGEPGDLYRGKFLVKEKGCLQCHSISGKGNTLAPAFDKMSKYFSPLYLAQSLWNHGPEMDKKMKNAGVTRPKFLKGEIIDLSAYIREASRGNERERIYLSPGNPQKGGKIFITKGCIKCHNLSDKNKGPGPNLAETKLDLSVTEIAGLMWNHSAEMGKQMKARNLKWPHFSISEMADLIAYLYFLKFENPPGNVSDGQKYFTEKGCAGCHRKNGWGSKIAPDLSGSKVLSSPIGMAQIMWNHAPIMEETITEKDISWPQLSGKEMTDIYAFLRTLGNGQVIEKKDKK